MSLPPRAVGHQAAIVRALVKLFELETDDLLALQRGGSRALEKLVRSYHYWAVEYGSGLCPYDHPKLGYFRMTLAAEQHDGSSKDLHCEHVVPVRWIVDELFRLRKTQGRLSEKDISDLMRLNEIVVVTKEEAKKLDKQFRYRMPENWTPEKSLLARLEACLDEDERSLVGQRLIGPA